MPLRGLDYSFRVKTYLFQTMGVLIAVLFLYVSPVFALTISAPLTYGMQSESVASLQEYLKSRGFFAFPYISGFYGEYTRSAVAAFQALYALPVTGVFDSLTALLIEILTKEMRSSIFGSGDEVPCPASYPFTCIPGTSVMQPYSLGNGWTPGFGGDGAGPTSNSGAGDSGGGGGGGGGDDDIIPG